MIDYVLYQDHLLLFEAMTDVNAFITRRKGVTCFARPVGKLFIDNMRSGESLLYNKYIFRTRIEERKPNRTSRRRLQITRACCRPVNHKVHFGLTKSLVVPGFQTSFQLAQVTSVADGICHVASVRQTGANGKRTILAIRVPRSIWIE
jgi:hypothetical protein